MTILTALDEGLTAPGRGDGRGDKRCSLKVAAWRKGNRPRYWLAPRREVTGRTELEAHGRYPRPWKQVRVMLTEHPLWAARRGTKWHRGKDQPSLGGTEVARTVCRRRLLTVLTRPGAKLTKAWARQAAPPTHLRGAPVVRGVVQRSWDGRVMWERWVLALHRGRMLVAIAPIVIAARVSKTQEAREILWVTAGRTEQFDTFKKTSSTPFPPSFSFFLFFIFVFLFVSYSLHSVALLWQCQTPRRFFLLASAYLPHRPASVQGMKTSPEQNIISDGDLVSCCGKKAPHYSLKSNRKKRNYLGTYVFVLLKPLLLHLGEGCSVFLCALSWGKHHGQPGVSLRF